MKAHQNRLQEVERSLQRFTVRMLDLCEGRMDVELLLDQDDLSAALIGGRCDQRGRVCVCVCVCAPIRKLLLITSRALYLDDALHL